VPEKRVVHPSGTPSRNGREKRPCSEQGLFVIYCNVFTIRHIGGASSGDQLVEPASSSSVTRKNAMSMSIPGPMVELTATERM
jgi:hypothetical protein